MDAVGKGSMGSSAVASRDPIAKPNEALPVISFAVPNDLDDITHLLDPGEAVAIGRVQMS